MNTDRDLVQQALARTPGAFERLVREHQKFCWHIVYRMVQHPEDARDLCQETFLRVHQFLHQYRGESSLKTWIGRIAYAVAVRHLERRRLPLVDVGPTAEDPNPLESVEDAFDLESEMANAETTQRLLAAVETLSPVQRTLLTLYHLDEMSLPEISQITGHAVGTVKSHLFRARQRLRVVLEPDSEKPR